MGIEISSAEFLLGAKNRGVSFSKTITLGRQHLFLSRQELKRLGETDRLSDQHNWGDYADEAFFPHFLDAKDISAIDNSEYQKASLMYDMNDALPEELHGKYDAVIDSGTLEHIFNFPTAIKNCMSLIKQGGSFFAFTPANNHCGHGFYQFSPELFFRTLTKANGFKIERIVVVQHSFPGIELSRGRKYFEVRDPAELRKRVGLSGCKPAMLLIQATRVELKPLFEKWPQQSDYVERWNRDDGKTPQENVISEPSRFRKWLKKKYPTSRLLQAAIGYSQRYYLNTVRNRSHYRRIKSLR
jgi:SAM-dependent methyltransferase